MSATHKCPAHALSTHHDAADLALLDACLKRREVRVDKVLLRDVGVDVVAICARVGVGVARCTG